MIINKGEERRGIAGTAIAIDAIVGPDEPQDMMANIINWFFYAPGQSIGWSHYILSLIHLRQIDGVRPPVIRLKGATHELMIFALDPKTSPVCDQPNTWRYLLPFNLTEQFIIGNDAMAVDLISDAVDEILHGRIWIEPPLSGQTWPWSDWIRTRAQQHQPCDLCNHTFFKHDGVMGARCHQEANIEGRWTRCLCEGFVNIGRVM